MSKTMADTFWMFPFNETGKEVQAIGHKLSGDVFGLPFDLFYYRVDGIDLLIDEITGMVVWGEADKVKDADIDTYFKDALTQGVVNNISAVHNQCLKNGIVLAHCTKVLEYSFKKQKLLETYEDKRSNILKKFNFLKNFKQVLYMKDFGQQTVASNALLIYPMHYTLPKGKHEDKIDLVQKGIVRIQTVPSAHVIKMPEIIRRGVCDKITSFYMDKFLFGYYYHDMNVLIIPDITNNKETKWFEGIYEYIKKHYLKTRDYTPMDWDITVGCDPEFELYNSEHKLLTGEDLNADGRLQRKIGADGHGKQLELRPEPSTDPKEVVDDLINLFGAVNHLRVDAKGDKEPLGGHIHVGITSESNIGRLLVSQTTIDMLDMFIGKHVQPLSGKARSGYGRLGDYRDQPWGFEYRTPPAAIFATKEMAYITMKLMRNLIATIMVSDVKATWPLTVDCLLPFLDKKEAEYYMNFPTLFKKLESTNIGQYWTTKKKSPIELRFYDKWNTEIKVMYQKLLNDTIVDGHTVICLYGVKSQRCAGLECLGASIPHPRGVHCEEGIAIGLPKACRMEGKYFDNIIREIKKKVGAFSGLSVPRVTAMLYPEEIIGCDLAVDTMEEAEPIEIMEAHPVFYDDGEGFIEEEF